MQARHEFKHILNYGDYIILRDKLQHLMIRDEHTNQNGEYRVHSLYFDTPRDNALRDKINGVNEREKFRIRRYLGESDYFMLEKKSKKQGMNYKRGEQLTLREVVDIQSGHISWMIEDERKLVQEFYLKMKNEQLKPKTIVTYTREPFICKAGNVRITLDHDIRTGLFSKDFLNDSLPTVQAGEDFVVLEVKYDQFIPDYISKLLQLGNRKASACSKYAICRIYG